MNEQDLASMSGETNYQNVQLPVYDEIVLNGNDGIFTKIFKTKPKVKVTDELTGGEKEVFEREVVGKTVELVWLKLRRKLIEKTQDGVVRQTSEHNTKKDIVTIYHYNGQATQDGILASSINGDTGLYPKMKVNQIVYAMDIKDNHIYKVILKGGSLSMQEKLENATLFYDYIGSMGKEEHFYTMNNVMTGTPYKTKLGVKFFCNFTKGRGLALDEQKIVGEKMKEVHDKLKEYDDAKATKRVDPIKTTVAGKGMDDIPSIDYGDIDYGDANVNVDDIPF